MVALDAVRVTADFSGTCPATDEDIDAIGSHITRLRKAAGSGSKVQVPGALALARSVHGTLEKPPPLTSLILILTVVMVPAVALDQLTSKPGTVESLPMPPLIATIRIGGPFCTSSITSPAAAVAMERLMNLVSSA